MAPSSSVLASLTDHRVARVTHYEDDLWLRIMDIPATLQARTYQADVSTVLEISDRFRSDGGRFALEIRDGRALCTPTDAEADVGMDLDVLGSLYLGAHSASSFATANRLHTSDSADRSLAAGPQRGADAGRRPDHRGRRTVTEPTWTRRRVDKQDRLSAIAQYVHGKLIEPARLRDAMEGLLRRGDRVALEGDNQKQADFLSRTLAECDPGRVNGLHMLISSVSRPEHLDLFEQKIAATLDLAYAGPQSVRIAQMVEDGQVRIGAIHTYVELYARMFTDLTPNVALLCATKADRDGNLFTGPNTEDTPTIAEATAFRDGVVLVQADEIVDTGELPRVDIPGDWVDLVVEADRPFALEPLFTRDPRLIGPVEILKAMIAIRGVYERHQVMSLNHGIGFDTAAIELLLPTYGAQLGLKGKIARHWTLNPHPTLIPAIESGWVESIHCFGGEAGMERYTAARPDVFFTGLDGSLRSNRVLCQLAGQYAVDMFIGSSLQIDRDANSSTVTDGRLPGFGGAPNMGHDPHGRRHSSAAWLSLAHGEPTALRGRKLVVQIAQTFQKGGIPTFVESLDAVEVGKHAGMPIPPVMIYGDDVSHVVTEEGVAYLYKAPSLTDRRAALSAIAGVTPIGLGADAARTEQLRRDGLVAFPEDLGIAARQADRSLLAARSIEDLVAWSGGLYDPPAQFRDW